MTHTLRNSLSTIALVACSFSQVNCAAAQDLGEVANIFLRGVAEYYSVPERDVYYARDRGLRIEEAPVAYYISQQAKVAPEEVIKRRIAGEAWEAIARGLGLSPEVFYYDYPDPVDGTPYGRPYEYWRSHPRNEWKTFQLNDDEIVNLVNLRYSVDHYRSEPTYVIRERAAGKTFVVISEELEKRRPGKAAKPPKVKVVNTKGKQVVVVKNAGSSGNGNGNGHDKSHGKVHDEGHGHDEHGNGNGKGNGHGNGKGKK